MKANALVETDTLVVTSEANDTKSEKELARRHVGLFLFALHDALLSLRRLDLPFWLFAWDKYSLAGAALGQFKFVRAVLHKSVVFEVAMNAYAEGRTPILGTLYDELARYCC